ncbi:Protein of unknown function DUF504 [Nitrosococcus halophilus Nc 4]|uniref:MJ1316 RNA cyclic group end recognition domain-containing protein n=1 Tax=Nitrosococcus halophilus (strain Nc4) TaxID=472759 RepID=D5C525_NITHN|nr:DUF504 domain-containing protein [Nitrosococcus halophilus]ADE15248.1 Protein of unknown function DUF504 [Nitrosococcus halophilus Nc 4]
MIPIHELLNRIRWDKTYGDAEFVIGYYDRLEDRVLRVSFRELFFPEENHFSFQLVDANGELHDIPYHRVREVFRNGKLIWHREQSC